MRKILLFVIILLFIIPCTGMCVDNESDAGSLVVSLDKTEATLGSIITLTLKYTLPAGASMGEDPEIKGIEDLFLVDKIFMPGQVVIRVLLDRTQRLETGILKLAYLDKDGRESFLEAPGIAVKVLSNIASDEDKADIKPIRDIVPITMKWIWWFVWGLVILAVLCAILAVFIALKRWSGKGGYLPVQDPPHILAKTQIENLLSERLFEKGLYKDFYFRLSEIIRRYIEAIRGFPAGEYTTEEIAHHIVKDPDRVMLSLLRHADLVKFADAVPSQHRNQEEIKAIFDYIDRTSPAEGGGQESSGGALS